MHYLDMHTVAIYATRLTFEHFRENVFNRFFLNIKNKANPYEYIEDVKIQKIISRYVG